MSPLPRNDKTLNWEEEEAFWSGHVELSVTSAVSESGNKIYSMMFGRTGKTGERVSGFLRPQDINDIRATCDQAEAWLASVRKENNRG
jgi:hypothetical protein